MKSISIVAFRIKYPGIAELIDSIDYQEKVILKSKDQIKSFLKNNTLLEAEDVLDKLTNLFNSNLLADSYLNGNDWRIRTFDQFLKGQQKLIGNKLELDRMNQDEMYINAIERQLEKLKTKDSRIIFLIEEKKKFEGNHYKANKKFLKNDDTYVYLKRRLKEISRLSDGFKQDSKEKLLPPRLQTNLTTNQRGQLFELLQNGGFIPNNTDPDCFNWAIAATDEIEPKQPEQWQSIEWKKSKMAFVELFLPFCETITSRPTNKFIGLIFKDENGDAMKDLKKPGKDEKSGDYGVICKIIDQLKP